MKAKRKRGQLIAEEIFRDPDEHKKLVYYRLGNEKNMFTYIVADIYDAFEFGSPVFRAICKKLDEQSKDRDHNFLAGFANGVS